MTGPGVALLLWGVGLLACTGAGLVDPPPTSGETPSETGSPSTGDDTGWTDPTDSGAVDSGTGPTDTGPGEELVWSEGVLELIDTVTLGPGSTWSGAVWTGERLVFTLSQGGVVLMVTTDRDLADRTEAVTLVTEADVPEGQVLADHKLLWFGERLYIAWNPSVPDDLFALAFDIHGNRVIEQVAVVTDGEARTNDVQLFTDGDRLYTLWGEDGASRHIAAMDWELNVIDGPREVLLPELASYLGATIWLDDHFLTLSGDELARDLIGLSFDADFAPMDPFSQVLLDGGGTTWNWFPSAVVRGPRWGLLFAAYHQMFPEEQADDDATLELAIWDPALTLVAQQNLADSRFHAADLAVVGGDLYVTYAFGDTYVDRFRIKPPDGHEDPVDTADNGG